MCAQVIRTCVCKSLVAPGMGVDIVHGADRFCVGVPTHCMLVEMIKEKDMFVLLWYLNSTT